MSSNKSVISVVQHSRSAKVMACGCLLALAGTVFVHGVQPQVGVAPVSLPKGGFGIDGDPMSGVPNGGVGDWTCGSESVLEGDAVLDAAGMPIHPLMTHHFTDQSIDGDKDSVFVGSCNWYDDPNNWKWKTADPSRKTDVSDVWVHVATSPDRHVWAVVGAGRLAASGDSRLDFEFLQNRLEKQAGGTFVSHGPHGGRTVDDLLVVLEFSNGGGTPELKVLRWQPKANGGYGYVDAGILINSGQVLAAVNRSSVAIPRAAGETREFAPNAFSEIAVDLTALIARVEPCVVQSVETLMVKTEVSVPPSSVLKDFVGPIQLQLPVPNALAGADIRAFARPHGTTFSVSASEVTGLYPNAFIEWSVVDGSATIESPHSVSTSVQVTSATARLRLNVALEGGCEFTDEISLITIPLKLEILKEGPDMTYLRWPAVSPDYHLEASGTIVSANWETFEATIEERDGFYYANVPVDQDQMFFRLAEGPLVLGGAQ